jgi:integrase
VNTKAAALAAERAHIERILRPELDKSGKDVPTLRAFVPEFMETYVRVNNKPSERIAKQYLFEVHLLPAFGRKRLDEISTRDVEKLKAEKLKTLAPKTVNNMLSCLGKTLRYAAECEVIDRIPRIRFVKTMESAFDFLEFEEYARLLEAASQDPETYPAILLAGDAGVRVGEIRALEWGDLDLVAGRLVVQRTDYRGYVGSPKGGRLRSVPMTARPICAHRSGLPVGYRIRARKGISSGPGRP